MDRNDCEILLENYCKENSIFLDDKIKKQLYEYYKFLVQENEKYNLTNIVEIQDVYIKHFIDCIAIAKYIPQNASVCDIGTGAGFPGMVLKIVRPDIKLILVDALEKRVSFLSKLASILGVSVECLHNRAEDASFKNKYLNSFDVLVSRAVARCATLCEYCLPFVKPKGVFIAMKGGDVLEEVEEAKTCINKLGGKIKDVITYSLFDMARSVVIIDKVSGTSNKYPRGQNKPKLSPIK